MACAALFGGYAAADPVSFEGLNYEIDKTLKTATVVTGEYSGDIFIPETISVEGVTMTLTPILSILPNQSRSTAKTSLIS